MSQPRLTGNETEGEFQSDLLHDARHGGWRFHGERTSRTASGRHATAIQGDQGWPDVTLAHPYKGLVIVELKGVDGSFGPGQKEWLEHMARYQTARFLVTVWRPVDWEFITILLTHGVVVYRAAVMKAGGLPSHARRRNWPNLTYPWIEGG